MRLSLIVAIADHDVIGVDGRLPWHLPDDLRMFRARTTGHTVIMGRRTHESIGKPLADRRNLVLSRDPGYRAPGVEVVHGFDEVLSAAAADTEAFVIGGEAVYAAALPHAARIYLTRVRATVAGDARFPPYDRSAWRLLAAVPHGADQRHAHAFEFRLLERDSGA